MFVSWFFGFPHDIQVPRSAQHPRAKQNLKNPWPGVLKRSATPREV